jgi:hypothetical protein
MLLVSVGLVAGSAAIWTANPSFAAPKPLRSGTIVGGSGVRIWTGQPSADGAIERTGCEYAVDCRSWLLSGCQPALAGRDPVLTASIVDVRSLANGRTRRFLEMTAPRVPPWGLWPGADIQFWRQDCTEIGNGQRMIGTGLTCAGRTAGRCVEFRIPKGARWMTLSAHATTARLSWTLNN